MTKRIMSEVFINMNRTVCRRTIRRGGFRGAYAVTVRFNAQPDEAALMIDTQRQRGAELLGEQLAREFPATDVGVFRVLCQLGRGDL